MKESRGQRGSLWRWGSQSSRGAGAEGLRLGWISGRADRRCALRRAADAERGTAGRTPRGGGGAAWPRASREAGAKPDNSDEAGAQRPAFSLVPTCSRRPSVLSVADSASRRLLAGCQASMISPASDAFLPPRPHRLCRSPGSRPPLHESSAHTRFPPLRSQPPVEGPAKGKGSGPDCSARIRWAERPTKRNAA